MCAPTIDASRGNAGKIYSNIGLVLAFATCWYFYFSSTFTLRFLPNLMWPLFSLLGFILILLAKKRLHSETLVYVLSIVALMAIAILNSESITNAEATLSSYLIYFFAALGGACLVERRSEVVPGLVKGFALFHALILYIQVFAPSVYESSFLPLLPGKYHTEIQYQMTFNHFYYGFTIQSSMCAMYLSLGIVAYLADVFHGGTKTKVSSIAFLIILVIALFFTSRRGSVIALSIVTLFFLWQDSGKKGRNIALVVVFALAILVVGADNVPGLSTILNKNDSVATGGNVSNGRFELWTLALQAWGNAPFFGCGVGSLPSFTGTPTVDNSYVTALAEHGLFGFVIFWTPFVFVLVKTVTYRKNLIHIGEAEKSIHFLTFSLAIQIMYLVMGFFEVYFNEPLSMFIYFLIVYTGFAVAHRTLSGGEKCESDQSDAAAMASCAWGGVRS